MESSTEAGVTAASTTTFTANPYTDKINTTTVTNAVRDASENDMDDVVSPQFLFRTPNPSPFLNHLQPSNVRGSVEDQHTVSGPDSAERDAANILANGAFNLINGDHPTADDNIFGDFDGNAGTLQRVDGDLHPNGFLNDNTALDMLPQETSAYAKLVFADGDYYITTHDVMLGRNMDVFEQWKRKKKQQKRARDDLASYKQEPSQPSQHGDADQQGNPSSSSQSLEGRPAPPSNVSEHGGVVSYQALADGEADVHRTPRRKRRSHALSKTSSTTSVDPTMIQSSITSDKKTIFGPDGEPEERTFATIPIHTRRLEDITKISKEHLQFSFDFKMACWQLHVKGNRAFVNDHIHEKGAVVPLEHNDEIMIATVQIIFKLPDNARGSPGISHGTFSRSDDEFSDDEDIAPGTSPVRRLSKAMEAGDSDGDEINFKEGVTQPKPKPKPSRKQEDLKKKKLKNEQPMEISPEAAKKVKKPKAGDKSSSAAKVDKLPTPPRIEPGSTLEGIPLEELPQKRKGPGRPPKNGLVSKRDQAMVEKKKREYEKRGEAAPPFDVLVNIVRAENKAKEQQQKALQNGEVDPGTSIVPSIETVQNYNAAKPPPGPKATTTAQTDTSAELARKASSPKPQKRTDKSPSPVPPPDSFTEEQMKKPSGTYVHIIDEILRAHPDGEADLPDIYLRIQKKYPHFKYGVSTQGWQSSVRHNLLQHDRFTEKGKSGKGKFWAIDWAVPIEKEQKKRKSPPSMPRQMMHTQQPGQYGQAQYGNPYGNSQANGQLHGANQSGSAYSSPYAHPGQNAQFGGQHPQQGLSNPNAQRPSGGQPEKPKSQWDLMIEEFIKLHVRYITSYQGQSSEIIKQKESLWHTSLGLLSDAFQNGNLATTVLPSPGDQEDAKMLAELRDLFTTDRLKDAARERQMPDSGMQSTVNQAVENGAASAAETGLPNRAAVANQTIAGARDAAPPTVQAGSQPNITTSGVAGGMVAEPANSVPPTNSQQPSPGGAGRKRSVDDASDEPAAKRIKGE
jgi:hypothetical protein